MTNAATNWKQIILDNLPELVSCTGIGVSMVTTLFQNQMINDEEMHSLMNENKPTTQRAQKLYSIIAPTWKNSKFPQFKRALEADSNIQAITYFRNATWIEPVSDDGDRMIDWTAFITANVTTLVQSTIIGSQLVIHLLQFQMITDTEMHLFMDIRTSNSEKALRLYTQTAPRWMDAQFEEFKRALQVSGNTTALSIFNNAERGMIDWKPYIQSNLIELVQSTFVGTELLVHLVSFGMIDEVERNLLMDEQTTHERRALQLYTQIINKWDNNMFEEFLRALELSGNSRAIVILKNAARKNTNVHVADVRRTTGKWKDDSIALSPNSPTGFTRESESNRIQIPLSPHTEERTDWNHLIKSNLQDLVESTKFPQALIVHLYTNEMIDDTQKYYLMNENVPPEERATRLYTEIAHQWDDNKFPHLIAALQASRNSKAFGIFIDNSHNDGITDATRKPTSSSKSIKQKENKAPIPLAVSLSTGNDNMKYERRLEMESSNHYANSGGNTEYGVESKPILQDNATPTGVGAVIVSMANPGNSYSYFYSPMTNDNSSILYSPMFIFMVLLVLALIVLHCLFQFYSSATHSL